MALSKYILILIHERDRLHERYYLHQMADTWTRDGHRVRVQPAPGPRVDADVVILHVDLTVVPTDYLEFARQYPVVVNGRVEDISKHRVSRNLVRREDGYDGPVIVKTDRNAGGQREAVQAHIRLPLPLRKGPFRRRKPRKSKADYRVFPSVREVPKAVWEDRGLVVEKFLPERRGDFFCTHNWTFFGERERTSLLYSTGPVSRGARIIRRELVESPPDELRRRREELGFDFGKFDYTMVDGSPVLFDTNRTPVATDMEWIRPHLAYLAGGLDAFL